MAFERNKLVVAGAIVFAGMGASMHARAGDERAVLISEDGRLEYELQGQPMAGMALPGDAELHCNYSSEAPHSGERTLRFGDGNRAVFSTRRIQFITADGAKTQIDDDADVSRKNWWCREDGLFLFSSVMNAGGKLGAVRVEWLSSSGGRNNTTLVTVPPHGENVNWSYKHSRLVDECLGMTFQLQGRARNGSPKPAQLLEYKLCPAGI